MEETVTVAKRDLSIAVTLASAGMQILGNVLNRDAAEKALADAAGVSQEDVGPAMSRLAEVFYGD